MRSVILLRPRKEYVLGLGSQSYKFFEGIPVSVPDDVAEICAQKRGNKFKPIFKVGPEPEDPDLDVARTLGVQLKFRTFSAER